MWVNATPIMGTLADLRRRFAFWAVRTVLFTAARMIRLRRGTTRIVVVAKPVALKFARGDVGRRCNRYEAKVWGLNQRDPVRCLHLCPVLWSSAGGRVLVMTAADPLPSDLQPSEEWAEWWDYDPARGPIDTWPGEFKAADWGILHGRRVLVNYSNPALLDER
jgi:hypothetical protein